MTAKPCLPTCRCLCGMVEDNHPGVCAEYQPGACAPGCPNVKPCPSSRCDGVNHWLGDQAFACPNNAPAAEPERCRHCGRDRRCCGVVCCNCKLELPPRAKPAPPQDAEPNQPKHMYGCKWSDPRYLYCDCKNWPPPKWSEEPTGESIAHAYRFDSSPIGQLSGFYLGLAATLRQREAEIAQLRHHDGKTVWERNRALKAEITRLEDLIVAAADFDPEQSRLDNTITQRTSKAMQACERVLAEGRAIRARRKESEAK